MEIEEDERRAADRLKTKLNNQTKAQERAAPNSPVSNDVIDKLMVQLRNAGPGPARKGHREARKRAMLKTSAERRKASATINPGLSEEDDPNAEKDETGLSSGGGGAGEGDGLSDVGTDVDMPTLSSPTIAAGDTPISSNTGGAPRKASRQLSPDDDPAKRAQYMLRLLNKDETSGGGDESDLKYSKPTPSADVQNRRVRRRQRQPSASTNGASGDSPNASGLGIDPGSTSAGEDAVARAKSNLLNMRRGVADDTGTASALSGPTGNAVADESSTAVGAGIGGNEGMPTPTIEIKEVD